MNPTDYVQTRCQRCGAAAWGHNQVAVPCSACGQPIAPLASSAWNPPSPYGVAQPPGAQSFQQPPGAQSFQQPPGAQGFASPPGAQSFQTPSPQIGAGTAPGFSNNGAPPSTSGGASVNVALPFGMKVPIKFGGGGGKVKTGAAVVGVAALAIGGVVLKSKMSHGTKKGMLSYSSLSMDAKKIDADKMIGAVASTATAWRKDAAFWSINLQEVHADGTVDASSGGAQVEYVSPAGVTSLVKKTRDDSIKKFSFGPSGVDYGDIWGASEKWDLDGTPPLPHCGIKNVVKQLASKGLTGDKTVRVTFDPQFAQSWSWHVIGEDPKIDAYFSMEDCSPVDK